jgi:hypothetical protein
MTSGDDVLSALDPILAQESLSQSPWLGEEFQPKMDLARKLLAVPIAAGGAEKQQSGRVAKALDAWVAHELRRAGFPENSVWPRRSQPRVQPSDLEPANKAVDMALSKLAKFQERLGRYETAAEKKGLTKKAPQLHEVAPAIRNIASALPGSANASILGRFYVKQVDVVVSSWQRGPDVLISGKTQLSSYLNNMNNRYEEAVGEGKNLRDRHPYSAMGFAHVVRSNIFEEHGAFDYLQNLLARLRKPDGFFDATMLLVLEWDDTTRTLEPIHDRTEHLTPSRFFKDLLTAVLAYTPVGVHQEVRYLKEGEPPGGLADLDELEAADEAAEHDAD